MCALVSDSPNDVIESTNSLLTKMVTNEDPGVLLSCRILFLWLMFNYMLINFVLVFRNFLKINRGD